MAQNFLSADRDQLWLMPPSVSEWLPEDHLAWFVVGTVEELDVAEFVAAYRVDGRGGAAYPPRMMVALLVYAYSVGEMSSRRIEKRCVEDVAFRVVVANLVPDHVTISRFRKAHAVALAGLFGQVLRLCDRAGLVRAGWLAVDGTKMGANASRDANRTAEQLAKDLLDAADEVDAAEDELFGDDNAQVKVPEDLQGAGGRAKIRKMLDDLNAEAKAKSFESIVEERQEREAATGRSLPGRHPEQDSPRRESRRHANVTDPDSRMQKVRGGGFVQGYNAQIIVTEDQIVVAAGVTNDGTDNAQFQPMVTAAKTNLRGTRVRRHRVRRVVADAGYWNPDNAATPGIETFIATGNARRFDQVTRERQARDVVLGRVEAGELTIPDAMAELGLGRNRVTQLLKRRRDGQVSARDAMTAKLATDRGKRTYNKRSGAVEPVFGQIKHNRQMRRFSRRGLDAVNHEWQLITATHNLLKLWRVTAAVA